MRWTSRTLISTAACFVLISAAASLVGCGRSDPGGVGYAGSSFQALQVPTAPVEQSRLPPTTPLPAGAIPWAGTVSHHLLTADIIDAWFTELRRVRDVSLFVIVSPRHWEEGVKDISLSGLPWDTEYGRVAVARLPLERLKRELRIDEDPTAFPIEHGVFALVPFVRLHFPQAQILPVIVTESPLSTERADRLAAALQATLAHEDPARWFLLVSTDFSHHGNEAQTERRRVTSLRFFAAIGLDAWPFATCDNKTGMRVLALLAEVSGRTRSSIFAYTDSFRLSGREPGDITSYFFSFVY